VELTYPSDIEAVAKIPDERKEAFEKWMAALDAEYVKAGSPYGTGPLATVTGVECWLSYFDDEYDPADAMADDLSSAD
jgi:hypothetical protein